MMEGIPGGEDEGLLAMTVIADPLPPNFGTTMKTRPMTACGRAGVLMAVATSATLTTNGSNLLLRNQALGRLVPGWHIRSISYSGQ